jgi:hypothetical protein
VITDHKFVGKREWGIDPPDNAPCQDCGQPKNQHVNLCPGSLSIAGEGYRCDMVAPHEGWAHANKEAQAIWQ